MIGHSLGEYVAACVSGVFDFPTGLRLVAERGRLMQSMQPGSMLAIRVQEKDLLPLVPPGIGVAALNGENQCVVSGPTEILEKFSAELKEKGMESVFLKTSHAF